MFHQDYSEDIDDILIYKDKVYLAKSNEITSKNIEETIMNFQIGIKYNILESISQYGKIPSLNKIFYIMIFNVNTIPTVEDFFNTYIHTCFIQNNDYTFSEKDFSIRSPKRYSYVGLKSRVYNEYLLLIKYYHLFLMLNESKKFDKVIYSIKYELYKGLNLNIQYKGNSYRLLLYNDGAMNVYIKNKNNDYSNSLSTNVSGLEYKINEFIIFKENIVIEIEKLIKKLILSCNS